MSRFTSSEHATAAIQSHVPFNLFIKIEFASGTRLFSTMRRAYTFGGDTYTGVDTFIGFTGVEETHGVVSDGMTLLFSGNDEDLMETTLAEDYHRTAITLYWAYADPDTDEPVDTPEVLWQGFVDSMLAKFDHGGELIEVACEDEFILWAEPIGLKWTDEDQKSFINSTDSFFNLQAQIVGKTVTWGKGPTDIVAGLRAHAINTTLGGWQQGFEWGSYLMVFL